MVVLGVCWYMHPQSFTFTLDVSEQLSQLCTFTVLYVGVHVFGFV